LSKNICPGCLRQKTHFDRAFCPYVYDGLIKELIHALKYKGKDYLGPFLGKLMADFIREYDLPMDDLDFIVPMPLHKTRLREREFNQAELLGGYIAREFNKELLTDVLKRHRYTKTQTELDTPNRLLNVKGSFSISGGDAIKGKNILLVDDVLTTGATASEATGALKSAGSGIVFVLTLAN
jgi:ComF family protein